MAQAFMQLEQVGNGFRMTGGGRSDSVMFLDEYSIGGSTTADVDTTVSFADYTAVIAGFSGYGVDAREMYMIKDTSSGTWHIHGASGSAFGSNAFAKVLFISRFLCTDNGETTQA